MIVARGCLRLLAIGTVVYLARPAGWAQTPTAELPPLRTILDAEAEGRTFPRAGKDAPVTDLGKVPGTAERSCVDATGWRRVRSGDFVAFNFDSYGHWISGGVNSGWMPLHPPDVPPTAFPKPGSMDLLLRATRLGGPESLLRMTSSRWARTVTGRDANGASILSPNLTMYASFVLPSGGQWLLVATAGPNWGCFLLTV